MPRFVLLATLVSTAALAQSFDAANQYLQERSHSRACDAFTAYLKANPGAPLAREATAKRAVACLAVGKGSHAELRALADTGEKDFARAWALAALAQRGERTLAQAAPLLEQSLRGEGRQAVEARALFDGLITRELESNAWNLPRVEAAVERGLASGPSAALRAAWRLRRAEARLRQGQKVAEAEKELSELGAGSSDVADDALFALAERRAGEQQFPAALELYDAVVKRFSPTTSNVRDAAQSRAEDIRRPSLSLSIPTSELPGVAPQVQVQFRNVRNARWTLRRVDPLEAPAGTWPRPGDDIAGQPGEVVRTWASTLQEPGRHVPGMTGFELETKAPGYYRLEVVADGVHASQWALVSQHVLVTKSDRRQLLVAVFDAETGAAQPDAELAIFIEGEGKRLARTNAEGLATMALAYPERPVLVWSRKGGQLAVATGGQASWYRGSRQHLAYVMTDRPLYKPGETVGFKLFLRSREDGPSAPLAGLRATLSITDAQGKEVAAPELTTNAFGTATFTLPLPKSAPLGAWRMYVRSPGHAYQQPSATFRVEEFKPPEVTVSVEPVGNPRPGEPVQFRVKAAYYSGGPVANASGRALVTVQPWAHRFGPWPQEEAPTSEYDGDADEEERPWRGRRGHGWYGTLQSHTVLFKTGADGTAVVDVPAWAGGEQALQYTAQVLVTDASRREVQGAGSVKVAKEPWFVDVRTDHLLYRPGERVTVQLRAEDANGRAADPEVVVRLLRLDDAGGGGRIAEVRTRLVKGQGRAVLDADAVGRVRVMVLDGASPDEVVRAETDLWLTSDSRPLVPGPGFQLLVDRGPLQVGAPVRVLVAGERPGGHVLLTLESDVLASARVVELKGRARFVELPLTADLTPNGWLHATRVEDTRLQQRQVPLQVRGSAVEFPVAVDFGRASAEPGSAVTATVTTRQLAPNVALETALTVVDEALFAIEPERTDFLRFFGRVRRPHGVALASSFNLRALRPRPRPSERAQVPSEADHRTRAGATPVVVAKSAPGASREAAMEAQAAPAPVMSAAPERKMSAKKERAEAADEEAPAGPDALGEVKARTDFGSSAGWWPALGSRAAEPLAQRLTLKDSLTSWKAIATVVTQGEQLGQGAGRVRTARPLMVRLQAPRFFIEGDEVVLSAVVESHLPQAADVQVALTAPGFKTLVAPPRSVRVEAGQTVRVDGRFKVVELGDRKLRAAVKAGAASDAMEWTLPALVHGSAQRQAFASRVKDRSTFEFELPEKRKASLTRVEVTLSPTLLSVMFDALPYLAQYPYGCTEQTLSRFVPAAIARRAVKDLGLPATRVPEQLDDMVQKGLERLYGFQHGDGGWGWWQADATNPWMSAYVVSALSLAQEAGVPVRADVLARGRSFLEQHLGAALNTPETHAYMVYALASTGGAPKAAVTSVFQRRSRLTPRARAQLALSLLHLKDPRARIAVENLDDVVKAAQSRPDAAVGEANDAWSTSAAIEATAFTVMAYARFDLQSPLLGPLTDFLVLRRNGGRWRSTRDTAFALYALSELARREGAAARAGAFVILANGKEVKRVPYRQGGLDLTAPVVLTDAAFTAGKNVLEVRHDGGGTGYLAATVDVFNMNDFIRGVGGDVKVKRSYTLLGRPATERPVGAGAEYGMPVESGVRVRVDLEITANKPMEFLMIEDLKPAGFEAVQQRSGPEVCNYQCAHAELRTDRVALFLSSLPVGTRTLSYELRAEVPGRFAALPARVEAMYAPELQATADEMRFEVRDAEAAPGQSQRP